MSYYNAGLGDSLFSSYGNTSNSYSSNNIISEYASIKNGSYKKLLKAYYAKTKDSQSSSTSTSADDSATITKLKSSANSLKKAADKLLATGKDSLFEKKEITTKNEDGTTTTKMDYDRDAIYKAVKDFADSYNSMLDAGSSSDAKSILRDTLSMTGSAKGYSNLLSKIGITVGSNNKLSVDEDVLKSANMTTVKSALNDTLSFVGKVADKATQLERHANIEAEKANTYNQKAKFTYNYNSGNIFNSFF